jgi:hypothetical protein
MRNLNTFLTTLCPSSPIDANISTPSGARTIPHCMPIALFHFIRGETEYTLLW